jgi:hypothetical protein
MMWLDKFSMGMCLVSFVFLCISAIGATETSEAPKVYPGLFIASLGYLLMRLPFIMFG